MADDSMKKMKSQILKYFRKAVNAHYLLPTQMYFEHENAIRKLPRKFVGITVVFYSSGLQQIHVATQNFLTYIFKLITTNKQSLSF